MKCPNCKTETPYVVTAQDIENAFAEHMTALDNLWPDAEIHGPRKVHVVELIDAIKLRLYQRGEKNESRYQSPFERAAEKIMGKPKPTSVEAAPPVGKTDMQLAHEAARARMKPNGL